MWPQPCIDVRPGVWVHVFLEVSVMCQHLTPQKHILREGFGSGILGMGDKQEDGSKSQGCSQTSPCQGHLGTGPIVPRTPALVMPPRGKEVPRGVGGGAAGGRGAVA